MEFIQDRATGEYVLIEMNPRFPAWVDFASSCGMNLPAAVLEAATGEDLPAFPPCTAGTFFIRHTVDLTCDIRDLGDLTALGEWRCRSRTEAGTALASGKET